MPYALTMDAMPVISSIYRIERQTVWQTCDRENILVLMVQGKCAFELGQRRFEAGPGQLVYIPAGQDYRRSPMEDAPATFYYFHFSLPDAPELETDSALARLLTEVQGQPFLPAEPGRQGKAAPVCLDEVTAPGEEALSIARQALEEYERAGTDSRLLCSVCVSHLIALSNRATQQRLLTQHLAQSDNSPTPPRLTEAVLYIRRNHTRPITVGEVCQQAGISRQHMIRLFKAELGMTPIQFINHTKIMHAKDLLWRDNTLTVKELSYELGFSDEHYFSRTFTHVVGESPSAFRRRVRRFSSGSGQPR